MGYLSTCLDSKAGRSRGPKAPTEFLLFSPSSLPFPSPNANKCPHPTRQCDIEFLLHLVSPRQNVSPSSRLDCPLFNTIITISHLHPFIFTPLSLYPPFLSAVGSPQLLLLLLPLLLFIHSSIRSSSAAPLLLPKPPPTITLTLTSDLRQVL